MKLSLSAASTSSRLEEGVLVRSTAALYKSYGVGRVVKVRGEQAKVEFNPSVFMPPGARMIGAGAVNQEDQPCKFLS